MESSLCHVDLSLCRSDSLAVVPQLSSCDTWLSYSTAGGILVP